jgi:hypothetical protein
VLPGKESPSVARMRAAPTAIAAASRPTVIRRLAVTRTVETGTVLIRENNSGRLTALRWPTPIPAAATPATGRPSGAVLATGRPSGAVLATGRPSGAVLATGRPSGAVLATAASGPGEASPRSADCGKPAESSGGNRDAASAKRSACRSSVKQAIMPARVPGGRVGHGSLA